MRHLQTLVTQEIRPHGEAQLCPVRPWQALEVSPAATHMREAQDGIRRGRVGSRGVAGEILARTAKSWGVTK